MKIILIGNYQPDQQQSMIRFAQMLHTGFIQAGFVCEVWKPKVVFGRFVRISNSGIGKWLGYLDKWILFPVILRLRLLTNKSEAHYTHFHICDHSNAPYSKCLPSLHTSITCHDVLAIRGALGYADAYCTASRFGKLLQRWIYKHLLKAHKVICVSQMTLKQLTELKGSNAEEINRNWSVIHVGFNANFKPVDRDNAKLILNDNSYELDCPFLLHVGSGLVRKNRKLLIDMLNIIKDEWGGKVCFAGEKIDEALQDHANELGLSDRIISIVQPDHSVLVALYSSCDAFIFPSYSEGFGWPLIEAQACGSPVIASDVMPMPEISGGTALHFNPDNPKLFADAFIWLQKQGNRAELIKRGFENIGRFSSKGMIDSYINVLGLKP